MLAAMSLLTDGHSEGTYADVAGLCAAATLKQIEEQDWSLNPGRYVGVSDSDASPGIERVAELAV